MGRRFVDMRTIAQRMQHKDDRINRALAKQREQEMAETALAPPKDLPSPDTIAKVLLGGDLSQLSPPQKLAYYKSVCESLGLNPLTKPFEFLRLSGKEVLYALRNATDQLRHLHGISVQIVAREVIEDTYVVTARATLPNGRHDESIGAVPIAQLRGENRSNALMKCETKAKRRVTLSLVGLSTLDESEVESIPGAQPVAFPDASPGPAQVRAGNGAPVTEGPTAAPANHNAVIPDAWKPFVTGELQTGTIVDLETESKAGRKSGSQYTKTTLRFWPDGVPIDRSVELYTLSLELGAAALAHKTAGDRVTVTTKDTPRGHEIVRLEVAHDAAF